MGVVEIGAAASMAGGADRRSSHERRAAMATADIDLGAYKLGWNDGDEFVSRPRKGISPEGVAEISRHKGEPDWMTKFRTNAFKRFERKPMLDWFAQNMPDLDF